LADELAVKVYQTLTCVSLYPIICLPYQHIYLCLCIGDTKLPDFPETAFALVNNGNAD